MHVHGRLKTHASIDERKYCVAFTVSNNALNVGGKNLIKRGNEDKAFHLPSKKITMPLKCFVFPYVRSGAYWSFHIVARESVRQGAI